MFLPAQNIDAWDKLLQTLYDGRRNYRTWRARFSLITCR